MKSFTYTQDNAYVVPALRRRAATEPLWQRKSAIIGAVLVVHGALLYLALQMVVSTPPEALPMAETEVILEQISDNKTVPTPIISVPKSVQQVATPAPNDTPKIVDDAVITRTVKPTPAVNPPVMPTEVVRKVDAPVVAAAPVVQPVAPAAPVKPVETAKPESSEKPSGTAKGASLSYNPKPPYPQNLESAGIGGTVGLSIRVSAEGRAISVSVISSSGQAALDESARSTVLNRWKFKPAKNSEGDSVAGTLSQPIYFKPSKSDN